MSGIFGIVRFGSYPADRAQVDQMATAIARWGNQPATLTHDDSGTFGHVLRVETPEDAHSLMPVAVETRHLLFTAEGRLDNRAELERLLGITAMEAAHTADSTVMLQAYLAWGERACAQLLGDWSLAAWHPDEQRLVLARDHMGNTALHYHRNSTSGRVLFASDARALYAAAVPRRLDEEWLAAELVSWVGNSPEATVDEDIKRVPPAHVLTFTPDFVRSREYWRPPERADDRLSFDDSVDGMRSLLDEAVRARCRSAGAVALTLSGGLDSGSVGVLAGRALGEQGKTLTAYTHVPIVDPSPYIGSRRFGDETVPARATALAAGITDHHLLRSGHISPWSGVLRELAALDQPTHSAANAFWTGDIMDSAAADGACVLLTGQGGNATISWSGRDPRTTLAGHWRERRMRGVASYLMPTPLRRRRTARAYERSEWLNSAIEPRLAERVGLAFRWGDSIGRTPEPSGRDTAIQRRLAILAPGWWRVGDLWAIDSGVSGVDARDPTVDVRVVEFALQIPDRHFKGDDGTDRRVLREAMRGLLPDSVRQNRQRGRQAADLVERLRRSRAEIDSALASVSTGPAVEYVSIEKLRAAWDQVLVANSPAATNAAVITLMRGLMAAFWITTTYG